MSKLDLYESALQEFAEAGNQRAKDVLLLASTVADPKRPDTQAIVNHAQAAIRNLHEALRINARDWDTSSDDECREAIDHLAAVLGLLPLP